MDIYISIKGCDTGTRDFLGRTCFFAKSWRKTLETRNILETRNDPQEAVGNHV
jgi:hypothetical protein